MGETTYLLPIDHDPFRGDDRAPDASAPWFQHLQARMRLGGPEPDDAADGGNLSSFAFQRRAGEQASLRNNSVLTGGNIKGSPLVYGPDWTAPREENPEDYVSGIEAANRIHKRPEMRATPGWSGGILPIGSQDGEGVNSRLHAAEAYYKDTREKLLATDPSKVAQWDEEYQKFLRQPAGGVEAQVPGIIKGPFTAVHELLTTHPYQPGTDDSEAVGRAFEAAQIAVPGAIGAKALGLSREEVSALSRLPAAEQKAVHQTLAGRATILADLEKGGTPAALLTQLNQKLNTEQLKALQAEIDAAPSLRDRIIGKYLDWKHKGGIGDDNLGPGHDPTFPYPLTMRKNLEDAGASAEFPRPRQKDGTTPANEPGKPSDRFRLLSDQEKATTPLALAGELGDKNRVQGSVAGAAQSEKFTPASAQEYLKAGTLGDKHAVSEAVMPLAKFNGTDIRASQTTVDAKGVAQYVKRIKDGERPAVLLEETGPDKYRIVDGHTKATAYAQLNVQDVPVLIRRGNEASSSKSSLTPPLSELGRQSRRVETPIKAYHGSPHDFDKFDSSKIGTGEGAQAFGHGLYFAEREGVAKSYKDALGGATVGGKPWDDLDPAHQAAYAIALRNGDRRAASADLAETIAKINPAYEGGYRQRMLRAKGMIDKGEQLPEAQLGRLYEVNLHAHPEEFLDWDKPLSQQSEGVKTAFEKIYADAAKASGYKVPLNSKNNMSEHMQSLHNAMMPPMPPDKAGAPKGWQYAQRGDEGQKYATQALRDAGIRGIRYKDQGSRGKEGGTYNYVVFDDGIVEIVGKDGKPLKGADRDAAVKELYAKQGEEATALAAELGRKQKPTAGTTPTTERAARLQRGKEDFYSLLDNPDDVRVRSPHSPIAFQLYVDMRRLAAAGDKGAESVAKTMESNGVLRSMKFAGFQYERALENFDALERPANNRLNAKQGMPVPGQEQDDKATKEIRLRPVDHDPFQ